MTSLSSQLVFSEKISFLVPFGRPGPFKGKELDKSESDVFLAFLELEINFDLKTQLREVNIKAVPGTQVKCNQGCLKANVVSIPASELLYLQKTEVQLIGELEGKKLNGNISIMLTQNSYI